MQPLNPAVIAKIYELVKNGIRNISQIELLVNNYVCNDLFKYGEKPDATNRRFFPLPSDLRNHYNKAFAKRKLAKIDQEHVSKLVDKWMQEGKKRSVEKTTTLLS